MKRLFVCYSSITLLFILVINLSTQKAFGQAFTEAEKLRNQPVKPYRIIGNIYYVGASDITSFLLTSDSGHILLDAGFAETAPQIKQNIEALGFSLKDVKILLNSQAHHDHAGGFALLKKWTNAKMMAMKADATMLESGGKGDFAWGDDAKFQPVKVDRILKDKDIVESGGTKLTAYLTPGHTKGNTTWLMKVKEDGATYDVVFAGSTTVPGYKLVDNSAYPNIIEDYTRTFKIMRDLHCDVFLSSHGEFFSMTEKAAKLAKNKTPNPFIDEKGYKEFLDETEKKFLNQVQQERKSKQQTKK